MVNNEFSIWLKENGLIETITTSAGDSFYTNLEKHFGVIRKNGEYGVNSFYLDDVLEIRTYDDENLIMEWTCTSSSFWHQRSTRFSTNEVYMKIKLKNQLELKFQIFRATNGNISRNSNVHVDLFNYACQVSQLICSYIPSHRPVNFGYVK